MHGILFVSLKDYVSEKFGPDAWRSILGAVDPETQMYLPLRDYPDEELLALVTRAVDMIETDADTVLRDFGRYIVPKLLDTYGIYADDDWTALEFVANTEEYIHESLRERHGSQFTPPRLETEWGDDDTVNVRYYSDRKLCAVAKGILDGVAEHYDEDFRIEEHRCMKTSTSDHCLIQVTRVTAAAPPAQKQGDDTPIKLGPGPDEEVPEGTPTR